MLTCVVVERTGPEAAPFVAGGLVLAGDLLSWRRARLPVSAGRIDISSVDTIAPPESSENTSEFLDPKNGGVGTGTELISALVKKLANSKTFFQDGRHEKSTFLIKV